jgi:hypothetical protein
LQHGLASFEFLEYQGEVGAHGFPLTLVTEPMAEIETAWLCSRLRSWERKLVARAFAIVFS